MALDSPSQEAEAARPWRPRNIAILQSGTGLESTIINVLRTVNDQSSSQSMFGVGRLPCGFALATVPPHPLLPEPESGMAGGSVSPERGMAQTLRRIGC
jgi:hypothetical protein